MKEYTYYFADGTKNTIEVEEKWYDLLKKMDEAERKQNTIMSDTIIRFRKWIMRAKLLPIIRQIRLKNGCGNR